MKKYFRPAIALILLALLTLILVPRPVAGLIDLRSANQFEAIYNDSAAALAYSSAASRLPWMPLLWEKAGVKALQVGDTENAITYLNKAVEYGAISKSGWFSLGSAYHQSGQLVLAVNAWMKALPHPQAAMDLATTQRTMGNFSAAIAYWQESISLQPENAGAHYALGLLLMATSPQYALPELLLAAQIDPALDPTVQGLRTVLNTSLFSNDVPSNFLLAGHSLAVLGEWDLAGEAFHNAITGRPKYAEAWAWLAEARQQQGLDGSSEMEQALSFDSQSAIIQGLYGLYLQRKGLLEVAMVAYMKASDLEPRDPAWKIALGSACEQSGDLIAAYDYYFQAVELAPENASTWRALVVFSVANNVDVAGAGLPAARKLIGLDPDNWQSFDLAGQAEFLLEQYSAAEIYLKKAIQMNSSQAAPVLHLGLVYLQSDNQNLARFYLTLARAIDPDGPNGWQAGRLLEQYFP